MRAELKQLLQAKAEGKRILDTGLSLAYRPPADATDTHHLSLSRKGQAPTTKEIDELKKTLPGVTQVHHLTVTGPHTAGAYQVYRLTWRDQELQKSLLAE